MKMFLLSIFLFASSTFAGAQAFNQIDSLLSATFNPHEPGISVGIINGRSVFTNSYGVRDIATKQPLTASVNFNIASLTKQFTAMAVFQLAEKGKLSLEDNIGKYLPALNKNTGNKITIRELLTHSSGIIDHYDYADTKNLQHAHNIDVFRAIQNIDSTYFAPGTHFRYSNTAFCLLGLIIEKASGMGYDDYMEQHIFKPAGMQHTVVWNEHTSIFSPATGYTFDSATSSFKKSQAEEHIFFSTEGDGGIYTSVDDYMQWFITLQRGRVFSKDIVNKARSIEFTIDAAKQLGYGFGWFVDAGTLPVKVYHSGDNSGFRTFTFSIPSQNFLIVIFANRDDVNIEDIVQKIYQLLKPGQKAFTKVEELTS
ncbi:MAG TPA: serine hydrolase domain-containing protein [Chitinophagaceae bacterium]|nr:serine hydrolase domain-containing protein [Chitinophagaceae bacterium]